MNSKLAEAMKAVAIREGHASHRLPSQALSVKLFHTPSNGAHLWHLALSRHHAIPSPEQQAAIRAAFGVPSSARSKTTGEHKEWKTFWLEWSEDTRQPEQLSLAGFTGKTQQYY